jgi:restriction system protein
MAKGRSLQVAEKVMFAAFKILKEAGGELRGKEVLERIEATVPLDDFETERYVKTGNVRWKSILHFYSIDCIKAGYMRKQKGLWILTDEGAKAMKLGPDKFMDSATKKYREWDAKRKKEIIVPTDEVEEAVVQGDKGQAQKARLDQYEEEASNGILDFIQSKNPYEFQDLVGALLTAMGYHISEVAEKGPDGGIDIVAYTDPLGTKLPRIIVQVKHRPNDAIPADQIQKLAGTLKRNTDVGIFVTSGSFSKPARKEARESREHIELIDFERLMDLWQQYYAKLSDEQKNLLPLHPIYFLGSNE